MGDRRKAIDFFNQAVHVIDQDRSKNDNLQMAYKLFSSACHADPTWWEGFYWAGNNNNDLKLVPAAIACWRRALELATNDEDRGKLYTNMGWRLHSTGKHAEAAECCHKALDLLVAHDHRAYCWTNLSQIYGTLGRHQLAIECAEKARELSPNHPTLEMNAGFVYMFAGQFQKGLALFENRFAYRLHEYLQYPYHIWDGTPGQTVFLCADQGLGDTLSFARFVPEMAKRCKYVHARVQPELLHTFRNAFLGVKNIGLIPQPCPFPPADAWTTFVSLPYVLGLNDEQFRNCPNLDIPIRSVRPTWKMPDRKLHIGIAWGGSPLNDIDHYRNIPFHHFLELYRVPGIQLYSLQCDARGKDMHDAGAAAVVSDLSPYIRNVNDTLAIMRELDLVITVESAVGHMAGAGGFECWIPYSWLGRDYRLGPDGTDILWYKKHRCFQQRQNEGWEPVFERIVEALREKVDAIGGSVRSEPLAVGA